MWHNSHRTSTECWQKTADFQKEKGEKENPPYNWVEQKGKKRERREKKKESGQGQQS